MNTNGYRGQRISNLMRRFPLRRGLAFGLIIVAALLAFEIFNYSTTVFALSDLLGDLEFASLRWATILAIAFCGIDFAGIARLFTPEEGVNEPNEVWYLFGAWLLAATMNAMLTWWGVSVAILDNETLGNAVVERQTLIRVVPVFVAILVWLIRVLIIGTLSVAGERLFSQAEANGSSNRSGRLFPMRSPGNNRVIVPNPAKSAGSYNSRAAQKSLSQPDQVFNRPEPTYHPVALSARPNGPEGDKRTTPTLRR